MEAEFYQAGLSNQFSHIRICEFSHVICLALVPVLLPRCSRYHRLNAPESKWHPSRSWPRCHSIVMAFSKSYYYIPQTLCQELWSKKIANSISIFRVFEVPEIAGANKDAAFDGSTASAYLMEAWRAIPKGLHDGIIRIIPEAGSQHSKTKTSHPEDTQFDAWIGIDVGIGNQERFHDIWEPGKASSIFWWTMLLWSLVDVYCTICTYQSLLHTYHLFCLWICLSNWCMCYGRSFRITCFHEWLGRSTLTRLSTTTMQRCAATGGHSASSCVVGKWMRTQQGKVFVS